MIALEMEMQAPAPAIVHTVPSCTPHRRKARWHVRYDDFISVCDDDIASADALRVFENKTNQRIAWLRREHDIPSSHLPHEDDLWIDMSLRDLEVLTLRAWGKSRYAACLLDQTREEEPRSLLELGYLRRRFVARSAGGPAMKPATVVYVDEHGESFIVVDKDGYYVDSEGTEHSAVSEGYSRVTRQYLYEIEAINTAIAEIDEESPPKAAERWKSVIERRGQRKGRRAGAGDDESQKHQRVATNQPSALTVQGGSKKAVDGNVLFTYQNNTLSSDALPPHQQSEHCGYNVSLCTAPWTAETLIALVAQPGLLAVPDPAKVRNEQTWEDDWAAPARFLVALPELQGLEPRLAWERVERVVRGMIEGPTWYATERARFSPITLRHVVTNWRTVSNELKRANWYPSTTTPYDGPPLVVEADTAPGGEASYAQGYSMVVSVSEVRSETDDVRNDDEDREVIAQPAQPSPSSQPPPQQGMTPEAADRLFERIEREFPTIHVGVRDSDAGSFVGIEVAEDQWFEFASVLEWHRFSPEAEVAVAQAVRLAESRGRPPTPSLSPVMAVMAEEH